MSLIFRNHLVPGFALCPARLDTLRWTGLWGPFIHLSHHTEVRDPEMSKI